METMTIEITDDMKKYVDRQIASGGFKDGSAVVQAFFSVALLGERRSEFDQKLLEAVGECVPWHPGDAQGLFQQIPPDRAQDRQT